MTTQHRADDRAADRPFIERIQDRVAELLEPTTTHETAWVRVHVDRCPPPDPNPPCHRCDHHELEHATSHEDDRCSVRWCPCRGFLPEPVYRWQTRCADCSGLLDGAGQRLAARSAPVEHPCLVDQLEQAVERSTAGEASPGPESRPAGNIEALDALGIMEREAAIWVRVIRGRGAGLLGRVPASQDVRELLALLADRAPTMDAQRLRDLDFDVLRWWARARVVTTWDTPPIKPHVPCMNCDRRGGIRVRVEPLSAVCLNCGAAWDSSTIGILGNHIQLMQADPIDQPAETVS